MSDYGIVGKVIERYFIAQDRKALKLCTTAGEELLIRVCGECCSEVWIEHLELPVMKGPATVTGVKPDESGHVILTDKGSMFIDLRRDSIYYGGWICWPGEDEFDAGIWGQNVSNQEWIEVKEDF